MNTNERTSTPPTGLRLEPGGALNLEAQTRAEHARAGRILAALATACLTLGDHAAFRVRNALLRPGTALPYWNGTPEQNSYNTPGARAEFFASRAAALNRTAHNAATALAEIGHVLLAEQGALLLPGERRALVLALSPLHHSWLDFPFPAWVPESVRLETSGRWSENGRTAAEYVLQTSPVTPHPNGTWVKIQTATGQTAEGFFWLSEGLHAFVIGSCGEVWDVVSYGTESERPARPTWAAQ